jgi:predicted nucleic acid-binding protein
MIIVDANLLVVLVSGDPRSNLVLQKFMEWLHLGVRLNAPILTKYEIASALTRLIFTGKFNIADVKKAWNDISMLPIVYHELVDAELVINIALSLHRQSAYDAAYIVLAVSMGAELWTLDGPLHRNASGLGLPVKLLQ